MATIDKNCFPHIFDDVFANAVRDGNERTLRLLGAVSREVRMRVLKLWLHGRLDDSGLHDAGKHGGHPLPPAHLLMRPGKPHLLDVQQTRPCPLSPLQHLQPAGLRIFDFPYLPAKRYHLLNAQELVVLHGRCASLLEYCRAPVACLRLECSKAHARTNIDWAPAGVDDVVLLLQCQPSIAAYTGGDQALALVLSRVLQVVRPLGRVQVTIIVQEDERRDARFETRDLKPTALPTRQECIMYFNRYIRYGRKRMLDRALRVQPTLEPILQPLVHLLTLADLRDVVGTEMFRFMTDKSFNATVP